MAQPRSNTLAALVVLSACALAGTAGAAEPHFREAARHVDAPVEAVWAMLADAEDWTAFTPGLRRVAAERIDGDAGTYRFDFVRHGFDISYSARVAYSADRREIHISLEQDAPRDIEALRSSWRLVGSPDGRSTRVELRSHFRSGMPVPGFIEGRALAASLEGTLDRLEERLADAWPHPGIVTLAAR